MAQFISKHHGLRLLRRNAIRRLNEFGAQDTEPEMVVEFEQGGGQITVNEDGTVIPASAYRGEWVLPDGAGRTEQTLLEWLRGHELNGTFFHEEEAVTPEPSLELRELSKLAAAQDVDAIVELGERENRTFQRPEVFAAIDDALEAIAKVAPKKVAHLQPETAA